MNKLDEEILETAKISSIAYGNFKENIKRCEKYEENKGFINTFVTNELSIKNPEYKKITLSKKYKIIDYSDNPKTGFQALALIDEDSNYIIAFRGTNDKKDAEADFQIGKNNINPQHEDARNFTQKILNQITKDKDISFDEAKKHLTLTGHSLGGIHTQQIAAQNRIRGFAFNPYGTNRLLSVPKNRCLPSLLVSPCDISQAVAGRFAPISNKIDEKWAKENIFTISYQDKGKINGDILSNFATNISSKHIGTVIPIIGKNVGFLKGHDIDNTIDTIEEYQKISNKCDRSFLQITQDKVNMAKYYDKMTVKYADKKQTIPQYHNNFCNYEDIDNSNGFDMK